jgi:hypothetical protein
MAQFPARSFGLKLRSQKLRQTEIQFLLERLPIWLRAAWPAIWKEELNDAPCCILVTTLLGACSYQAFAVSHGTAPTILINAQLLGSPDAQLSELF